MNDSVSQEIAHSSYYETQLYFSYNISSIYVGWEKKRQCFIFFTDANVSNETMLDKDPGKGSTPEVQVKTEPGEKIITDPREALAQQGAEQTRFERDSGTWRANSMYNAAGLGTSDYLGLADPGPSAPTGVGSTSSVVSSGAVQQNPAAREQLAFSYYRNTYNPVRWRNIKSLMFKRGFACLYCGKNFSRRAHLERHKLIHTGEKPYGCELCGRRFNQKSSVKEHMKIHQKGRFHMCDSNVHNLRPVW